MLEVLVAILAAGASRRLGRPKQLVIVQGEPLLRRQCRTALDAGLGPVAVVLGYEAERMEEEIADLPVGTCRNGAWEEGLASSIRIAVTAAKARGASGVLLLQADQYRVTAQDLRTLHAAWVLGGGHKVCRACSATYKGPPVILPQAHFQASLGLTGDMGARKLLTNLGSEAVNEVELPNAEFDLDTPEQLLALEATFEKCVHF
jgi:CTP:molybdopterin cytidylyltransferase MocA